MAIITANNQSMTAITSLASGVSAKSLVLLATETASSDSTIQFTSGIDSTYKEYIFKFYDIHPSADDKNFTFQGSTNTGSSYGVTITSTLFQALHFEGDTEATVEYEGGGDLAQSTSYQEIIRGLGNDNDQAGSGELHLFNPSSTTFVKHFMSKISNIEYRNGAWNTFVGGYFNTTSAIDAIQFKLNSGNIDSGTIKMYGVA